MEPYGCCTATGATASPQGPLVPWCSQQLILCPVPGVSGKTYAVLYYRRVSTARCTVAGSAMYHRRTIAVPSLYGRSATACAQGLSAAMRHARRHTNSAGPHTQLGAATCRYLPGGAVTHTFSALKPLLPDNQEKKSTRPDELAISFVPPTNFCFLFFLTTTVCILSIVSSCNLYSFVPTAWQRCFLSFC